MFVSCGDGLFSLSLSSSSTRQHSFGGTCGHTCYRWYLSFRLSFLASFSFSTGFTLKPTHVLLTWQGWTTLIGQAWATPTCEAGGWGPSMPPPMEAEHEGGLVSRGCCSKTREWREVRQRQQTHLHLSEPIMTLRR